MISTREIAGNQVPFAHETWRATHFVALALKKALESDALIDSGVVSEGILEFGLKYDPVYNAYGRFPLPSGDVLVVSMHEATDCGDGARLDTYALVGGRGVGHLHLAYSDVRYDLEAICARGNNGQNVTAGQASRDHVLQLGIQAQQALDFVNKI